MIQTVTDEQARAMLKEYEKGGKFKEYVDKACYAYYDTVLEELHKVTVFEYYKSVTDKNGCNREKE